MRLNEDCKHSQGLTNKFIKGNWRKRLCVFVCVMISPLGRRAYVGAEGTAGFPPSVLWVSSLLTAVSFMAS